MASIVREKNALTLTGCEASHNCLRFSFTNDEVLAVWNPADVEIKRTSAGHVCEKVRVSRANKRYAQSTVAAAAREAECARLGSSSVPLFAEAVGDSLFPLRGLPFGD